MYVCSTTLKKTLIVQSVLVMQGQIFVQSPIRVKSAKANCTKQTKKNTNANYTNNIAWNRFQNATTLQSKNRKMLHVLIKLQK